MQLTPDQKKMVEHARALGEKRTLLHFTPEQRAEWQEAAQQELDAREENSNHFRKIKTAAELPGFFGDVRRAIALSGRRIDDLARCAGVEVRLLSDFRAGEAELPAASLDRLLDTLGLRLMLEIRR